MKILRSIVVAFSIYSRIPMPHFDWDKEDMRYHLIFFPWIGGVIGGLCFGCFKLFKLIELPLLLKIAVLSLIPLIITGGFHLDGFLDVNDALSSYGSKDKKLNILKDPHVGGFAMISLLIYSIFWGGALSYMLEHISDGTAAAYCLCFATSRAVSGISAIAFKKAKPDGMLNKETEGAGITCAVLLAFEAILCMAFMLWADLKAGFAVLAVSIPFLIYYRHKMYKQFEGVSGDTAGYFVTMCELLCVIALAVRSAF